MSTSFFVIESGSMLVDRESERNQMTMFNILRKYLTVPKTIQYSAEWRKKNIGEMFGVKLISRGSKQIN